MLTDNLATPLKPVMEHPELDYIDEGPGVSYYFGLPGENVHAVILAHNTTEGKDYFRNLSKITAGTELFIQIEKEDRVELLRYKAVADPYYVGDDKAGAEFIYSQDSENYASSVTLYTCDTVNGAKDRRTVVIFALEDEQ
jgi:LPXTG-site transpeptidase (sortase) family protein